MTKNQSKQLVRTVLLLATAYTMILSIMVILKHLFYSFILFLLPAMIWAIQGLTKTKSKTEPERA